MPPKLESAKTTPAHNHRNTANPIAGTSEPDRIRKRPGDAQTCSVKYAAQNIPEKRKLLAINQNPNSVNAGSIQFEALVTGFCGVFAFIIPKVINCAA